MALEAGFGSIVAFNRAFKEKYAMTPRAYRVQRDAVPAPAYEEKATIERRSLDDALRTTDPLIRK